MATSALIIVDNHGEIEYYYYYGKGFVDALGVEICFSLHEPMYFYNANKHDWKHMFSDHFTQQSFRRLKKLPADRGDIGFVYHIIFGKENVVVDLYTGFGALKDWKKDKKYRIFQTDFLTGYKSRLRTLCIDNF